MGSKLAPARVRCRCDRGTGRAPERVTSRRAAAEIVLGRCAKSWCPRVFVAAATGDRSRSEARENFVKMSLRENLETPTCNVERPTYPGRCSVRTTLAFLFRMFVPDGGAVTPRPSRRFNGLRPRFRD